MITERTNTGGNKEFVVTEKDRKRWENEDTPSTRAFKEALREWREKKNRTTFEKIKYKVSKNNIKTKKKDYNLNRKKRRKFIDVDKNIKKERNQNPYDINIIRFLKKINIEKTLFWFVIHWISLIIMFRFMNNPFEIPVYFLFYGLGVYLFATIVQAIKIKKTPRFRGFFTWFTIYTLSVIFGFLIIKGIVITTFNLTTIILALSVITFRRIVDFVYIKRRHIKLIGKILIVIILFLQVALIQDVNSEDYKVAGFENENNIESINYFEDKNEIQDSSNKNIELPEKDKIRFNFSNFINVSKLTSYKKNVTNEISGFFETEVNSIKTDEIENHIFRYTNDERIKEGFEQLIDDSKLSEIARQHSTDMAINDFFDHTNLVGEDPSRRAEINNYETTKTLSNGWYSVGIGENIGKMTTGNIIGIGYVSSSSEAIAKAQVKSWMDSPGHRSNILSNDYTHLGVGVSFDGSYYVSTQNFW